MLLHKRQSIIVTALVAVSSFVAPRQGNSQETCPASEYTWDVVPNPQCEAQNALPPVGTITSAEMYGPVLLAQATEHGVHQCTFNLLYGSALATNFQLSFQNGTVQRHGKTFSSSYYSNGTAQCWSTASWVERGLSYVSTTPIRFPETIYVVDANNNFYAVEICVGALVNIRVLIDTLPANLSAAAQSCSQAGFIGVESDLSNLSVIHTSILGTPGPVLTHVATPSGFSSRTVLVTGSVLGAGVMFVNPSGKVAAIGNCSGHYRPPVTYLLKNIATLQNAGVTAGPIVNNSLVVVPDAGCSYAFFTIADEATNDLYTGLLSAGYQVPVTALTAVADRRVLKKTRN